MRNDEAALGMIVRLSRTAEIAKVAAASGHDFIFIDAQHGPFSPEVISDISQAAAACGIAGLVRVRPEGKRRWYGLRAQPLAEVADWLEPYRRHWSARLDALERHLEDNP